MNSIHGVWGDVPAHLVRLAIAFALALPVGWDREKEARSVGIRTFPLIAVAACGVVLLGIEVLGEKSADQARIIQGLITAVGFLDGSVILKQGGAAYGTATAASIWNVGVVGAAVGSGYYDIGFVLAAINFLALRLLTPLKESVNRDPPKPASPTPGTAE